MSLRTVLSFAVAGAAGIAGCALHDWDGYASGVATVSGDDAGKMETGTTTPSDGGDAGDALDSYGSTVQADAPVAWFRFEESSGATSITDVAKKYTGTVQTAAYFGAAGVAGHAVQLDGSGGFDLGDVFDFAGRSSFTLEAWVKTTSTAQADQRLMFKRDDTNNTGGYVAYLAGDLTPHFEVAGAALSSWNETAIPAGKFTHIVVTVAYVNGTGTATLWANGQQANKKGYYTMDAIPNTTVPLSLGQSIRGTLDEVAFYDKALTDARVLAHYLAGSGGQ